MRGKLRWVGALIALAAVAPPLVGQQQNSGTITGTVTDQANGQPLSDARISVAGSVLQTTSDARGNYRLVNVPAGQVSLSVRRIGYRGGEQTVTLAAGGTATADFRLSASVVTLDEVIVSGTAGDARRSAQAASVAEISVGDIAKTAPVRTFAEILQSRVPGVQVSAGSGTSGVASQIRIRGSASLSLSNEPLVVIDGILVANTNPSQYGVGGQASSRLSELDPKEIESIEVVKGPAASALYGADAAAGVIQIITRRGRIGTNRFTQDIGLEYQSIDANFEPMDNFGNCLAAHVAASSTNPLCRGQAVGTLVSDNPLKRTNALRTGDMQGISWSGSGGNGTNFGYFLHGGYETENGTVLNNSFDRRNARANLNWTPSSKLTLNASLGMNRANIALPQNDNNVYGWLGGSHLGSPLTRTDVNPEANLDGWFGAARHVAAIAAIENIRQTHRSIASLQANFVPTSWWSNRFTVGADWVRDEQHIFFPKNSLGSYQGNTNTGDISQLRNGEERYTVDYLSDFRLSTGESLTHNISAGFQLVDRRFDQINANGQGLTVNSNNTVGSAASKTVTQDYQRTKSVGFFGQLQTTLNDRLTVSVGARMDANSSFGNTSEWFFLPKAGISYVISQEPWWNTGLINTLRLRAAYGVSGRSPNPGASLTTLTSVPFASGSAVQPGAILNNPGNDSLKAERGEEVEFGFDAGFLQDRVGLEVTYYSKRSKDLLLQRPLPGSLGYGTNPFVNIGELQNKGLELAFTAQPISAQNLSWDLRFGFSTLDSKITNMGGIAPFGTTNRFMEGQQPGVFVGNRIRSIDEATGVVIVSDDLEPIGNLAPAYEGNLSSNLTLFRNFRIYASLDGKGDFYIYNNTAFFRETQLPRSDNRLDPNKLSRLERLRRYGNDATGQPAFVREGVKPGFPTTATVNEVRDGYVEKGDFIKLRELSVTWTLPTSLASAFRASGASVTLAGQNLAVWTDYQGFDPEVISNVIGTGLNAFSRTDFLTMPATRRFVVRFNAQF